MSERWPYVRRVCKRRIKQIAAITEALKSEEEELEDFVRRTEPSYEVPKKEKGVLLNVNQNHIWEAIIIGHDKKNTPISLNHISQNLKSGITRKDIKEALDLFESENMISKTCIRKNQQYYKINKDHPNYKLRKNNG